MVPRCYLRQNPPFMENHDLPSLPRPTLPCNLPPRCPYFLPHVSFTSRLVVPPLSLLHTPSYVCSNNHLLGGVTIEKQLEKHAGNWSPERAQMFFTKTSWNDRYLGGGEALPLSGPPKCKISNVLYMYNSINVYVTASCNAHTWSLCLRI